MRTDTFTPEERSKIMRSIKSSGSKEEVLLTKTLWHRGHRYRKNNKKVFGKPDITFAKHKIAIFIDSEFFHGHDWENRKLTIKSNQDFWYSKIERNIRRDKEVNKFLIADGWRVIRFWSKFIKSNLFDCIAIIEHEIFHNKA